MGKDAPQNEAVADDAPNADSRVRKALAVVRGWTAGNPLRSAAVGGTLLVMIFGTLAGWIYLSSVAADADKVTLDDALAAWDERDLDGVQDAIRRLQNKSGFDEILGGALFALGAVKSETAKAETSATRQRNEFLIASRYLEEASAHGFTHGRVEEGMRLLGETLVRSKQFAKAIKPLSEALAREPADPTPLHRWLAQAYSYSKSPDLALALDHNQAVLADPAITPDERADAQLMRAQLLERQQRFADAMAVVGGISATPTTRPWIELLSGQVQLGQARQAQAKNPDADITSSVAQAQTHLQAARQLETIPSVVTRRAMLLEGVAQRMSGNQRAALQWFADTRKAYGSTPEGLAAILFEAELLEQAGQLSAALAGYRRVLKSAGEPSVYHNDMLPLAELQSRLSQAVIRLASDEQYGGALSLLDHFRPLFAASRQLEQRAKLLETWGNTLIGQATGNRDQLEQALRRGRRRLREAGAAYEQLGKTRYATKTHTDDLWKSADNFFAGQSYSSAIRVLNEYLLHEPEYRNPQALLRLGQAHLAMGNLEKSVDALEECIDFHPLDVATYQARIDCARAYRSRSDLPAAQALLEDNLMRSALAPRSPEWRESLFEYGSVLFELGKYDEAILYLERFIRRLEQHVAQSNRPRHTEDPAAVTQKLSAYYLIGQSHRAAATEPLAALEYAESEAEAEKIRDRAADHLLAAQTHFEKVLNEIRRTGEGYHGDPLRQAMLRNCYMLLGSVLFDQGLYARAKEAYSNVSALYRSEPFVLETFVQISHCWRRLNEPEKARGIVQEAQFVLEQLPPEAEFLATTSFTRDQWQRLFDHMLEW